MSVTDPLHCSYKLDWISRSPSGFSHNLRSWWQMHFPSDGPDDGPQPQTRPFAQRALHLVSAERTGAGKSLAKRNKQFYLVFVSFVKPISCISSSLITCLCQKSRSWTVAPLWSSPHAAAPHQAHLNPCCSSPGSDHTLSTLVSSLSLNAILPVSPTSSVLDAMTYHRGVWLLPSSDTSCVFPRTQASLLKLVPSVLVTANWTTPKMRFESQLCLEDFSWAGLAIGQVLERRIRMNALVKQEFLSTCILVDGFMLSKITEQTVFNMRKPSNLPAASMLEHRWMRARNII